MHTDFSKLKNEPGVKMTVEAEIKGFKINRRFG